jgi:hypothetical protein
MRRALVTALSAVSVLTVASGAAAKEPPNGFQLCGPNACAAIGTNDGEPLAISLFYGGGSVELWTPKVPPASFYAMHWSFQQGETHTGYYVPLLNAFRFVGSTSGPESANGLVHWVKLGQSAQTILERITSTLEPFPAPVPSRVTVGGRPVQDPESYLRLWSVGNPTYTWPRTGFTAIKVTSDMVSPWTDRAAHLSISRRGGFLMRDSTVYRIPTQLARLVRARASLR